MSRFEFDGLTPRRHGYVPGIRHPLWIQIVDLVVNVLEPDTLELAANPFSHLIMVWLPRYDPPVLMPVVSTAARNRGDFFNMTLDAMAVDSFVLLFRRR